MKPLPTWSVVTLTRNTPFDVMRYVSWYLGMGADRIYLYFHEPTDPNIALVAHLDRVTVIPLTPELIEEMDFDPEHHGEMQDAVGFHAYERADTDWVLRCDIDELLYLDGERDLRDLLAQQDDDLVNIRFSMAEALSVEGASDEVWFRTEMKDEALPLIYGDAGALLRNRKGLLGHRMGKAISRSGISGLRMYKHGGRFQTRKDRPKGVRAEKITTAWLLHFNIGDFESWYRTLGYRIAFSSFDPLLAKHLAALLAQADGGRDEIESLYRRLTVFDATRCAALLKNDAGLSRPLDFAARIACYFPDQQAETAPLAKAR